MKARTVRKVIFFGIAALLVTACSMRRVALDNYRWFATRLAVSYLDLSSSEKAIFQTALEAYVKKFQAKYLKETISVLESVAVASNPIPIFERLEAQLRRASMDACIDFAPLAAGLNPDQIERLRGKLSERDEKFDPDANGGVGALRKKQFHEGREMATRWLGTLTSNQEDRLENGGHENDADGHWERDYMNYRTESQGAFLRILTDSHGNPSFFEKKCRQFVENQDQFLSDVGRQTRIRMRDRRNALSLELFAQIQPAQRIHLRSEITALANDLRAWSEQIAKQQ